MATLDGREVERVETGIEPARLGVPGRCQVVPGRPMIGEAAFVDVFDGSTATVELPADSSPSGVRRQLGGPRRAATRLRRVRSRSSIARDGQRTVRRRLRRCAPDLRPASGPSLTRSSSPCPTERTPRSSAGSTADDVEVPGTIVDRHVRRSADVAWMSSSSSPRSRGGRWRRFPIELPLLAAHAPRPDGAFIVVGRGRRRAPGVDRQVATSSWREIEVSSSAMQINTTSEWIVAGRRRGGQRHGHRPERRKSTRVDGLPEEVISAQCRRRVPRRRTGIQSGRRRRARLRSSARRGRAAGRAERDGARRRTRLHVLGRRRVRSSVATG